MSGDATATGRTCLLPGEVDPAGQATLCVTPKPVVIDTIPTVGAVSILGFVIPLVCAGIVVSVLAVRDARAKKKSRHDMASLFKHYLGRDE
jgi:hypothetical protein